MSTHRRNGRIRLLAVIGLAALAAACAPRTTPPAPAPTTTSTTTPATANVLCPSTEAPGPDDRVAVVDPDDGPTEVVTFEATTSAEVADEVASLEENGTVLAVATDKPVSALAVEPDDDDNYPLQWGFQADKMDYPAAWTMADGDGVRIAVIDTGVQGSHPDLQANVVPGVDFVTPTADGTFDGSGHGTHVAGTIGAIDNEIGVIGGAPEATIVPVRVLDCEGDGSYSDVIDGILWASDPSGGNAKVLNVSLGGIAEHAPMQAALQTARDRGALVVAAGGNSGTSGNQAIYPAAYDEAFAVGSIELDGTKSDFSNNNAYVDIAAPGRTIESTKIGSSYGALSGTSMATPHVSALAALLVQACAANDQSDSAWVDFLVARIQSTAWPTPISGFPSNTVKLASAGTALAATPCGTAPTTTTTTSSTSTTTSSTSSTTTSSSTTTTTTTP